MPLALLYTTFAGVSIAANLGSQWLSNQLYDGPYCIALSMLVGTGVGLVVKYVLDKRWIFRFQASSAQHEAKTFVLYSLMGVITTFVFWGMEVLFHWLFASEVMRYVGGLIGLVIGYIIKYMLDKHLVFINKKAIV